MKPLAQFEVWFVTGSQQLYGDEALRKVTDHADQIVKALDASPEISITIVRKPVVTTSDSIQQVCLEANAAISCIGVVTWMHTFSPAKMWIAGLSRLQKPMLHFHTQYNLDLPWASIDMDFMNLNQSAHGDREFGFVQSRMRGARAIVVGHWRDPEVVREIDDWARAACGWHEAQGLRVARFGDNMREVAVTEGDKVAAQLRFGVSVNGFGVGELVSSVQNVSESTVDELVQEYEDQYDVAAELRPSGNRHAALRYAARIEAGLREFLENGRFRAFTDTFEDLGELEQLPGIAVQRLMSEGYGFGAEGDWKTAALVRIMKVMATGRSGGTSFMEDYTYHLSRQSPGGAKVLGAHMLEVCPSIAAQRPSCEVHPLSIGGKQDPVRLIFTAAPGPAIVVGLIDTGDRFRFLANEVDVVLPDEELRRLPVGRAVWQPRPDLKTAAAAWLLAGGPHHTSFSAAVGVPVVAHFAEMAQSELLVIDGSARLSDLAKELRWNQAYYHLASGL